MNLRPDPSLLLCASPTPLCAPAMPRERRRSRHRGRPVRHVVMPGVELRQAYPRRRETIARFLERQKRDTGRSWTARLPTICIVNGQPLPRAFWRRWKIRADDEVVLYSHPGDPGTAALAGALAGAAGGEGAATGILGLINFSSIATSLLTSGLLAGGLLAIRALTAPKPPDPIQPLHSIHLSGNTARPGASIPTTYGRVRDYPDYAATPWSYYASVQGGIGNSQVMNVPLCLGLGKYHIHQIWIDDTVIWDENTGWAIPGAQFQYCDPGVAFTLFPTNIDVSPDVTGQLLPGPLRPPNPPLTTIVGPFACCPPGTQVSGIALDFILPGGCFTLDGNGNVQAAGCGVSAQAQLIDDSGAPLGSWFDINSVAQNFATRQPLRFTVSTDLSSQIGRYQVRLWRGDNSASETGANGASDVTWAGLRGFITAQNHFPNVSVLGLQLPAFQNMGPLAAGRISVYRTRILPVWNGSAMVEQPTRNPLWAFWDASTNTTYGGARPGSKVDFATVVAQAAGADSRGDCFDYTFKSAVRVTDAFDTILRATRCRHRWAGDVLSVVRDEFPAVPQMLLTDREIMRGSLQVDWQPLTTDASDALIGQYIDENTWSVATVQYPPNSDSFTAQLPANVQWDGVVQRAQAFNETAYLFLQSVKRRATVKLETEHDGRMLGFWAGVGVQSELPQNMGAGGRVTGRPGTLRLALDPNPVFDGSGQQYIAVRTKTGGQWGPVKCGTGAFANEVLLDSTDLATVEAQGTTLDQALARATGAEDPSYALGAATTFAAPCLVAAAQPNGDNKVTLSLIIDDASIHSTDPGSVPLPPTGPAIIDPDFPSISGLNAIFRQGLAEPTLDVTWWNSPGASSYHADISYDGGATFEPCYDGNGNGFTKVVNYASARIRVQAIGKHRGAFSQIDVTAPVIVVTAPIIAPSSFVPGLLDLVANKLPAAFQEGEKTLQFVASVAQELDFSTWKSDYDQKTVIAALSVSLDDAHASIDINAQVIADTNQALAQLTTLLNSNVSALSSQISSVATAAADATAALASDVTTVKASLGDLSVTVTDNASAVATIDGKIAGQWLATIDANGFWGGFVAVNDGTSVNIQMIADHVTIASPVHGLGTPVPLFDIGTVGGVASIVYHGNLFGDGDIQTRNLAAASVNADKVAAGAVLTTHLSADAAVYSRDLAITNINNTFRNGINQSFLLGSRTAVVAIDHLQLFASFNGSLSGAFQFDSVTVQIVVDGIVIQTVASVSVPSGQSGNFALSGNLVAIAPRLAVGNHTVSIVAVCTGNPSTVGNPSRTLTCTTADLIVQEPRNPRGT